MPQMAPSWWSMLFIIFLSNYLLTMNTMYFFNIYKMNIKNEQKSKESKLMNWKW